MKRAALFLSALLLCACAEGGALIMAGAAEADVTPSFEPYQDVNGNRRCDPGEPFQDLNANGVIDTLWLGGFGPRQPTGVHDPLSARTLALQTGEERFSFTAVDALGLSPGRILKIRDRVRQRLGDRAPPAERLIIASTHTHQAPDSIGIFGPGSLQPGWDAVYLDLLVERAADSIVNAWLSLAPATLEEGEADAPGAVRDIVPPRVMDTRLRLLRALGRDGSVIATVISIANHPEAAWNRNTEVSADYPGRLRQLVEERFGGLAIFFAGALGLMQTPAALAEEGFARVQAVAEYYFQAALEATGAARKLAAEAHWDTRSVALPLENFELYTAVQSDTAEGYRDFLYQSAEPPCKDGFGCLDLPLSVLRLGRRLTLVTVPGEIVPELVWGGISRPPDSKGPYPDAPPEPVLKDCLPAGRFLLLGLAGAEIGYIFPKIQYDPESHFSYQHSPGPSAAGIITENLCRMLNAIPRGE